MRTQGPIGADRPADSTIVPLTPFSSATAMLQALQSRRISAVELLDLHLRQIAQENPTLNAIVTPDFEQARRTAKEADVARAHGDDRLLLGLPVTIKDYLDVEGLPTTAGDHKKAHAVAAQDGLVAARVRAAGAVIMGKTNVSLNASDWHADNPLFGRTNNPWDRTRTPGGSTGGGAAAVAAGMTPLEFGSDFAGSIRVPAAFCGCYGHNPSATTLPCSGEFPGSPLLNPALITAVQGPLSRSAADLELALGAAGPEIGEGTAWHIALPPARHERLTDYRVAVLPLFPWLPVDDDIVLGSRDQLLRKRGQQCGDHHRQSGGVQLAADHDAAGGIQHYLRGLGAAQRRCERHRHAYVSVVQRQLGQHLESGVQRDYRKHHRLAADDHAVLGSGQQLLQPQSR